MRARRALGQVLGPLLAGGIALVLFEPMARRVAAGNSDGATVILEGRSIEQGNLLLSGWRLSLDSFWTIDALINAAGVAIAGVDPALLHAVPIAIAAAVVAVAVASAVAGFDPRPAALAGATAAVVLLFVSRPFALFFLQGPYHVGTTLYCLAAFALLARGRLGPGWVASVVLLGAAVLGDFQATLLGVLPILLLGALEGHRCRSIRAGALDLVAGGGALVLALLVRVAARWDGGYASTKANPLASKGQILRNVGHLPNEVLSLLGVTTGPYGPTGVPAALRFAHLLVVAVLAIATGRGVVRVVTDLRVRPGQSAAPLMRLENLLVFGVAGDLLVVVFLPITSSDAYARYLTAGIVFAAVLGAREIGRWATRARSLTAPLAAVGVITLVGAGAFVLAVRGPVPPSPQAALATFLEHSGLTNGVGDYWSSSIVTVDSRGTVAVRPVIASGGRLVRYAKQSDSTWYRDRTFQFYVFDTSLIWNGDDRAVAVATFGPPSHTAAVGTYRVLEWNRPITVDPVGSEGP
jgi:hypothetical protein